MALPTLASARLVDQTGRPTSLMLEAVSGLSAQDVIADGQGAATQLFRARLQSMAKTPLPTAGAALFEQDGSPTRVMVHLLAGLP